MKRARLARTARSGARPLTKAEILARVPGRDTSPELAVRSLLHRLGYRFRIHVRSLPGTPDIAIKRRKAAIFVHGCFWHQHPECKLGKLPRSRPEYWLPKLRGNVERDAAVEARLVAMGYKVLIVWECEVNEPGLADRLSRFLGSPRLT